MWERLSEIARVKSPWLTLVCERYASEDKVEIDYWRVETASSVIAVTIQDDFLVMPRAQFRPGVGQSTLDFPGGRCEEGEDKAFAVRRAISRELGLVEEDILSLEPVNRIGLDVNSSASNQKVYGFLAQIRSDADLADHHRFAFDDMGISELFGKCHCLQCRGVLLEYVYRTKISGMNL